MMRILHLSPRYWPAVGGAEIHFGEISGRLAAAGHQVTVVTSDALDFDFFWDRRARRIVERSDEYAGVRILRFPIRHPPVGTVAYAGVRRLLWLLSNIEAVPLTVLWRLAHLTPWTPDLWRWVETTAERFDLVAGMVICVEPFLEAGLRLARRQGIPFVAYPLTHLGAGLRPGADALSRFYTMRHQVALVHASAASVMQTPTEQAFYTSRGIPADRLPVIGPGVTPTDVLGGDGERCRSRHGIRGPLVASLSSMSYDKGTMHLVEAVRHLWQAGVAVELALAGALTAQFREFLAQLPAHNRPRLHVLGQINEDAKRDLLAAADIFAMPSRTDSFGIAYLEAWLYRKPVIAARTWGVMDVVDDGRDGLLVPFGDVQALATAIGRLLAEGDLRTAMGASGEAKVYRAHTWEAKFPLVHSLYLRLTAGKA